MSTNIRQRTQIGLLAAACIFVAIGIGVVLGAQRLISDAKQVAHTHEVIAAVEALEARLRDAEATQRGYLLTANPAYLSDYRNATAALPQMRDHLFALVADSPEQQAQARAFWARIETRLSQTTRTLERYRTGGLPAAQAAIDERVLEASAALRRQAVAFNNDQSELLIKRGQSSQVSATVLRGLALLGIPLGLVVILVVYWLLLGEIRRRARAEAETGQANDQLRIGLDSVERARTELQALNQYGNLLQSCAAPEEALQLTRSLLEKLLPDVPGCVYRIRNSQDYAELAVTWGASSTAAPGMMPVEACWALRRGQVHAASSTDGARCVHFEAGAGETGKTLCVPLLAHGKQLGLLCLSEMGDAMDGHQEIIKATAEQLSMALANLSLQERLRQQSIRDPLSGLFNRRYLEESATRELNRCMRRDLPLSLLMFDIDHFKSFNDSHGHAGGDAVLAHFGQLLQAMSRPEDIACRYGGEEFTLILPDASLASAQARAEAIRAAVETMRVPHLGKVLPQVTVSIGVAGYPGHGNTPEGLIQVADEALYRAKRAGRNRVEVATSH
ncbi:MAG: diguanylate cyclase [Thermomonas sp.]